MIIEERDWHKKKGPLLDRIEKRLGFPCVTKPPRLGSSVGVSIASERESFFEAVETVFRYDTSVLIEEFIPGLEITSPVLDHGPGKKPTTLPLVEIVPKTAEYFDYEAKYTPGASDEITPARLDEGLTKKAQRLGLRAHQVLGCAGLSRTDMILNDGRFYVLETNTIPGITEVSLCPKAARAMGISFPQLLDHIINAALENHRSKKLCTDR